MSRQFTGADGVTYTWVDADTFTDGKESYRVQGYNAPEEEKIVADEEKGLRFKQGQVGGKETTRTVERITEAGGFNIVEDLGKTDSFGRKRVRLKNQFGDDLTNTLYQSGAIDVNLFTDEQGIQAVQSGRVSKLLNNKRGYDKIIAEELSNVQNRPVTFKEAALNEREYLNSVVATVAAQQGLDLTNEDDYRTALKYAQDGVYDMRSIPFQGIEFRSPDRTIENVAYSQFGTAWNQGWSGMYTGLAGFAELIGVGLGSETLEQLGADKVEQARDDLLDAPMLRNLDYRDVDDVWSAWGYLTNNVAMSAPYLITLTAGTLLGGVGGVVGAGAVGIAYGSIGGSYAGQVWNDIQGPKGRAEAAGSIMAGTAMAVLDRLGLAVIMKPSQLLTKKGREEVIKALAKKENISIAAATTKLNKISKAQIKEVISGMGNFASDNINNSAILRRILAGAGRGGLAESITEAAQEGLGYSASAAMSEGGLKQNFNPNEFTNLITSAAVAGGTLGASFSSAGQVIDVGDRYAMQKGLMLGSSKTMNEYDRLSADIGNVGSVENIITELQNKTKNKDPDNTNANITVNYAEQGKINRGTIWDKIKNAPKYLPELYRASSTTAFRPELLRRSPALQKLYALAGQPLGRLYSGRDVQAREAQIRADLLETINPKRTFKRFGMKDSVKNSQRISDMIRRYERGERDPEIINNLVAIEATIKELEQFAEKDYVFKNVTYQNQKEGRDPLKKTDKWWLKHQSWDWKKVRQNRDEWFKFMRDNTNYSAVELDILYNKISNNEPATDFSLVEGVEFLPGSTKGRRDEISDKPGYEKFANTNILQNMVDAASQNAKYVAYTEYFGAGGKYLDELFIDMKNDGLTDEEIAEVAYHTKAIIDAGTGNFNPIQNKMLSRLQNTAAFYSAMVGLPLSAISSFPEFAMILYQGRGGKDVRNGINSATGTIVDMLKNVMNRKENKALSNIPHAEIDSKAQQRLTKSGLFNDDAAIATRLGLGETDISKAWWQKQFYKFSLIAGITQSQRAIAASAVAGFVSDRIRILAAKPEGVEYNQDQLDVYNQLKNLGMDVDKMLELYNKYNNQEMFDSLMDADNATAVDNEFINDQMDTVTWYFTNDRIQNPQAYNRPLFFQDPHYQLFVQFNGFISTFTANIIPKLYNDYLKNGSPRMKYNTFAMMVTMMAMAGASQWLKDYIKFGQSTPYLSNAQLVQRALQASGLLGTGERIVQMGLPLYKSRDQNLVDRFFGETIGSSPGIRNVITAVKGIDALSEGDTNRAVKQATKLVPGIAPITPARNTINDLVHGRTPNPWPFRENE